MLCYVMLCYVMLCCVVFLLLCYGLISVVSIFVNPTQFNDQNDLKKYPSSLENDLKLLQKANVDVVFIPDYADLYFGEDQLEVDIKGLDFKNRKRGPEIKIKFEK